jgi:hypothetical protein
MQNDMEWNLPGVVAHALEKLRQEDCKLQSEILFQKKKKVGNKKENKEN